MQKDLGMANLQFRRAPMREFLRRFDRSLRRVPLGLAFIALPMAAVAGRVEASDIRLGFLGGLTGPTESIASPVVDAVNLAVQNVNAQGGIDGNNLTLVTADGDCNP